MSRKEICKNLTESKTKYTEYIENHISNVIRVFTLFGEDIYDFVIKHRKYTSKYNIDFDKIREMIAGHDSSKFSEIEFEAYRAKFYPCDDDDKGDIEKKFEEAWEHHYTHNKHHPEFWTIKIGGEDHVIQMSNEAFIEMICDWVAMSMNFKESTYEWWQKNRDEKSKYFIKDDIEFIDSVMNKFKLLFDFSEGK